MADKSPSPNYPDILGAITGGDRVNVSVVQVAAAISPRVIRAGKTFTATLLIQNASDVDLDVTANLKIPERDAKNKRGRFVCKMDRLVVGLGAAEIGYVTLPVTTTPDTALGADYKISFDLRVTPRDKKKPNRIRHPQGGGQFDAKNLTTELRSEMESLQSIKYVTSATGLRGTTIEIPFSIIPGKVGTVLDAQPGWKSLWTMKDLVDDSMLVNKFADDLREKILPALEVERVFDPLLETTKKRFAEAGYQLMETEALLVTKMLCLILSFATPSETLNMVDEKYNVHENLKNYKGGAITLPEWAKAMLHLLNRTPAAADHPVKAVTQVIYDDLLRDAMRHGFDRIEMTLDEELGSDEERDTYVESVMASFSDENDKLDFDRVYMPMVIAGITAFDSVVVGNEEMVDQLQEIISMLEKRDDASQQGSEAIYQMAYNVLSKKSPKYGYEIERMK